MADVNDLYSGIIMPQGGIFKPGAPVVMPSSVGSTPSGVSRVTPEGLNVRGVQTVAVDGNGTPILSAPQKAAAITRALVETAGIPHASGTVMSGKDESRLSPSGGIVSAYGEMRQSPAEQAIASALINTANGGAWGGGWGASGLTGLDFSGAPNKITGAPTEGDPWGALRFGEDVAPTPGLVTSVHPVDALHAKLLASQGPAPGASFLEAQGQSTKGLSAGEVANNLKKAMSGSGNHSFGIM